MTASEQEGQPPPVTGRRVASGTRARVEQGPRPRERGWREAPSALQVLRACGWLRPGDETGPQLRVEQTSSSHTVHRVTTADGRSVVVKHVPRSAAAEGRGLRHELFVYRLAAWIPEVARAVPKPVYLDEGRQLLVIEALGADQPWSTALARQAPDWLEVCTQLGRLLAGVHTATLDMALSPSPAPGILGLPESIEEACHGRHESTQALMRSIAQDASLEAALRAGALAYEQRCVIHGDLRQANWLMDERGGQRTLKIFDWELAGSGDPAFDLASVLGEIVLAQIQECGDSPATAPLEPFAACAPSVLLSAYCAEASVLRDSAETRHKLLLFVVARLLHVACECTEQGLDAQQWPVSSILMVARQLVSAGAGVDGLPRSFLQ